MKAITWSYQRFSELNVYALYEILKLRVDVFIVEQECPYHEVDGNDLESIHITYNDDKGLAAYARLLPAGVKYADPSIGRVIVREDLRGTGLAHVLMEAAMEYMIENWHPAKIRLQGQTHLAGFYEKHDFEVVSASYLEDGIPHVDMVYQHTSDEPNFR